MKKLIWHLAFLLMLLIPSAAVLAQPSPATGDSNIKIEESQTMNFDNLSDSVTKNVQKRLDETRRAEEWKHHNRRKMARAAVYGLVAILFVVFSFFNKRKSKHPRKS